MGPIDSVSKTGLSRLDPRMASSRDGDCSTTARSVSNSGDDGLSGTDGLAGNDGLSGSDGLAGNDGLALSAAGNALKLSLLFSVLVSSFSSSSKAGRLSCGLWMMGLLLRFLSLCK